MADLSEQLNVLQVKPLRGGTTYYSYKVEAVENSTDVLKNVSNVTLKFYIKHSSWNPAFEGYSTHCGISVDGIPVASGTNKKTVGTSYVLMLEWTGDIQHDANGRKDAVISVWLYHSSTADFLPEKSTSDKPLTVGTLTLTDIPRKSELTVADGTLGTAQTLKITRQSTDFTHTIKYTCGTARGTICEKSSSGSEAFIAHVGLASQNTTGTAVSITFTITTYYGAEAIGELSYIRTFTIPNSVAPSVMISHNDPLGYANTYGGYLQNLSSLFISLTPTQAYGAEIVAYSLSFNGNVYPSANALISSLWKSGTFRITASVTDNRGRTGTATADIEVIPYTSPTFKTFRAFRCDLNGTENGQGAYIKVLFDAKITSLSDKNTALYTLKYKPTDGANYITEDLTQYSGDYDVTGGYYVFAADVNSSFDIQLTARDNFSPVTRTTAVSSASTLISVYKDKVISIGELADLDDDGVFNVAFESRLKGGIIPVELPDGTNLDDVTIPYFYNGLGGRTYTNTPFDTAIQFSLNVYNFGMSGVLQEITKPNSIGGKYWRFKNSGFWHSWMPYESDSGGGSSYTEGTGIDITNDVISVETIADAIQDDSRPVSSAGLWNMFKLIDDTLSGI